MVRVRGGGGGNVFLYINKWGFFVGFLLLLFGLFLVCFGGVFFLSFFLFWGWVCLYVCFVFFVCFCFFFFFWGVCGVCSRYFICVGFFWFVFCLVEILGVFCFWGFF